MHLIDLKNIIDSLYQEELDIHILELSIHINVNNIEFIYNNPKTKIEIRVAIKIDNRYEPINKIKNLKFCNIYKFLIFLKNCSDFELCKVYIYENRLYIYYKDKKGCLAIKYFESDSQYFNEIDKYIRYDIL